MGWPNRGIFDRMEERNLVKRLLGVDVQDYTV
jgi:hypothetical protein